MGRAEGAVRGRATRRWRVTPAREAHPVPRAPGPTAGSAHRIGLPARPVALPAHADNVSGSPSSPLPADPIDALIQLNTALAGRYVIEREIGRGGMATVFLARDVKHHRQVALKLLDPELGAVLGVERFLSEIRVTANLQHPNLLPLFDSGEADGLLFYVMPFVDGESLRALLEREKQLPVDEAVRIAVSIAGALEYAHEHGVIHRDLKPENILLQARQPVIADFGIALAVSRAGGARITQTGLSLGTPQYMSPEQAAGDRVIDGRSDIYSLAAVLYEMLTGDPPHMGNTAQAIIAKVLTEKPPHVRVGRETVPEYVDRAVERGLAKLPADRFATAREFADALRNEHAVWTSATTAERAGTRARSSPVLAWSIAALAALSALVTGTYAGSVKAAASPAIRFKIDVPPGQQLSTAPGRSIGLSPDGRTLLYAAVGSQAPMLFTRRLDELQAKAIPGTENPADFKFSADGRWISFVDYSASGRLVRVPSQGGPAAVVAAGTAYQGTSWTPTGAIVHAANHSLWRLDAPGGTARELTTIDTVHGERDLFGPYVFPDGKDIMFGVHVADGASSGSERFAIISIDGTNRRVLDKGVFGSVIAYVDGWLLYGRENGTMEAQLFDQRSRRFSGDPVTVLDGVMYKAQGGIEAVLSPTGTLAFIRGETDGVLAVLDRNGGPVFDATEHGLFSAPAWSPDGRKIALAESDGNSGSRSIWIYDVASKALSRLTSGINVIRPAWTADGKRVAFIVDEPRASTIWWAPADGSGPANLLYRLPGEQVREVVFSPDGRYAVLRTDENPARQTQYDLWYLPLADTGALRAMKLLQTPSNESMPSLSPDSRWLAYQSDETGRDEVYVRPAGPGPGGRVQVSAGGGTEPRWAADGTHIVYRAPRVFRSATISVAGGVPTVMGRDSLFADTYLRTDPAHQGYDIAPDGRFAMFRNASGIPEIVVVANWLTEVREKLHRR